MKSNIKKKFIDILFEPEEDEEEIVEKPKPEVKQPVKKQEKTVKAADILYRKPERSAFIDLEEKKKKKPEVKKEVENVVGDYEFSSQISPIFGLIKESQPKISTPSKSVNESLINRPDSSHLEIITSPIYGYGNREDFEKEHPDLFTDLSSASEEEELHRLLDEDYGFDDHTYDDIDDDDEEINLFNAYGEDE